MGEKKVTIMVLKVDLQCSKCYKKVKKVLCKFPQIQDQLFDEKKNTVRINVLSSSPEEIRDKLCCKGDGSIKSIEILKPQPPPPPPPPPRPCCCPPVCCRECYEGRGGGPCYDWCYGRPVHESWGGGCSNRVYYRSRCSDYICEENPAAPCTVM